MIGFSVRSGICIEENTEKLDSNQTASSNLSEQRDIMRAIVALQQAQQDQKKARGIKEGDHGKTNAENPSRQSSPSNTAKTVVSEPKVTDLSTTTIGSHSTHVPQPPQPRYRMRFNTLTSNPQNQTPHNPGLPTYSEANRSREQGFQDKNPPTAAFQITDLPPITTNNSLPWSGGFETEGALPRERSPNNNSNAPAAERSLELHLYLLKPIVRDFFDRIELTWSVQNTRMQDSAIRNYLSKNEKDGMPSVLEMLQNLHAYEHALLDNELLSRGSSSQASLLSLKRTKTDIRHRDITIKDVPGLQFVMERPGPPAWQARQAGPYHPAIYVPGIPPPPPPISPSNGARDGGLLQEYQVPLVIQQQETKKRLILENERMRENSETSMAGAGDYSSPNPLRAPRFPNEDSTDEELFRVPLKSRAHVPDEESSPVKKSSTDESSLVDSWDASPYLSREYSSDPNDKTQRASVSASIDLRHAKSPKKPSAAWDESQAPSSFGVSPIEHEEHSYQKEATKPESLSLRVSRPVSACLRCRFANVKCDGRLPACTACEEAGQDAECASTSKPGEFLRDRKPPTVSRFNVKSPDSKPSPELPQVALAGDAQISGIQSIKFGSSKKAIRRGSSEEVVEKKPAEGSALGSVDNDFNSVLKDATHQNATRASNEHAEEAPRVRGTFPFGTKPFRSSHPPQGRSKSKKRSKSHRKLPKFFGEVPSIDTVPEVRYDSKQDSDSSVTTNPSIIQGPLGDDQSHSRDHWSYEPSPPHAAPISEAVGLRREEGADAGRVDMGSSFENPEPFGGVVYHSAYKPYRPSVPPSTREGSRARTPTDIMKERREREKQRAEEKYSRSLEYLEEKEGEEVVNRTLRHQLLVLEKSHASDTRQGLPSPRFKRRARSPKLPGRRSGAPGRPAPARKIVDEGYLSVASIRPTALGRDFGDRPPSDDDDGVPERSVSKSSDEGFATGVYRRPTWRRRRYPRKMASQFDAELVEELARQEEEQEAGVAKEQEEVVDEDAMIKDLLGKYTTLFD